MILKINLILIKLIMFFLGKCLIFFSLATSSLATIHLTYPSSRTTSNYYIIFEAEDINGNVEFLDKYGEKVGIDFGVKYAYINDNQSDYNKLAIEFLPKIPGFDWPKEKKWFLILEAAIDYDDYRNKYFFIDYSKLIANFIEELNPREDIRHYTNSTRRWQMKHGFECDEAKIKMASNYSNPLFATIIFKNLKFLPFANQESADFKSDQDFTNCKWYMPYLNFLRKNWWIFAIVLSIFICCCCCCECCRELAKSIWECFANLLKAAVILIFSCLCGLCCLIYHVRQRRQELRQNREEQIRQRIRERLETIHRLRRLQQEAEGQAAREQIARELFPLLLLHSMMNEHEENEDEEAAGTSNQSNTRRQPQSSFSAEAATTATNPIAFKECSICQENERAIVFEPCMHLVACEICSERIKGEGSKCPICRRQIQKMSRVFLP